MDNETRLRVGIVGCSNHDGIQVHTIARSIALTVTAYAGPIGSLTCGWQPS
jgi:hypothetical protein